MTSLWRHLWPNYDTLDFKILTQCVKLLGERVLQVWWWYLHWFRRYRKKTRGGLEIAPPPVGRGLKTRIAEHRRDMKNHTASNALVAHANKEGHLPRWEKVNILEKGIPKNIRRSLEATHIQSKDTTNTRSGFYTLAQTTARLATTIGCLYFMMCDRCAPDVCRPMYCF